ncbi:NitT/TauT family transport system ATP-binding protein [Actinocorallia herbida]|uniref:NitT/TauT family transport system ATP-binding protein n=1 Tax=Actinocorallia herbida TaxID=58109 RepID=A0A3N1CXY3_9ACTN|nr:ABC transporter ATP-binding protein [Actinocorallia herbida]ROO86160.1 NitT/TauT family transport system ATP-binding protein [Actinocorallia herbida]
MTEQAILQVDGLRKSYGSELVLADITLEVFEGELVSIVGPSGCGKTTMLRCLGGLMPFDSGTVRVAGEDVTGPPDTLGIVFQDYSRSLLPWLSVAENVRLPLRYKPISKKEAAERTAEALASVGLSAHLDKKPWQLSGGMQQRVAIARALAYRPRLLLMDEPFASVDAQTRVELEDLTQRLWSERKMTIGFVTHDIDEAIYLGGRIVVLTRTPTTIREVMPVDLPRPREQIATKATETFADLRASVFSALGHHQEAAR